MFDMSLLYLLLDKFIIIYIVISEAFFLKWCSAMCALLPDILLARTLAAPIKSFFKNMSQTEGDRNDDSSMMLPVIALIVAFVGLIISVFTFLSVVSWFAKQQTASRQAFKVSGALISPKARPACYTTHDRHFLFDIHILLVRRVSNEWAPLFCSGFAVPLKAGRDLRADTRWVSDSYRNKIWGANATNSFY